MASAVASLSRRLRLLSRHRLFPVARFCTTTPLAGDESEPDDPRPEPDDPLPEPDDVRPEPQSDPSPPRVFPRLLEKGLDPGVYKAIMVGRVGQKPVQKHLKSGRTVVLFSLGTGGIRNNRRPLDNEEPREYAERCAVQWHRVCVYTVGLGVIALKNVMPGSVLYLEGNIETKVFNDPVTGLVRRIREIALRRDGRIVFIGKERESQSEAAELTRVGYY